MGAFSDLYRGRNNYDIMGRKRLWLTIAAAASMVSILGMVVLGLNLSIDFRGGTVWKFSYAAGAGGGHASAATETAGGGGASGAKPSESDIREAAGRAGVVPEKVLYLGADQMEVQAPAVDVATSRAVSEEFAQMVGVPAGEAATLVSSATVSPTWGAQVSGKALRALIVFLVLVSIYIAWRFEWQMAVAAFIALIHDILITVGIYSFTRFTVAPATVIATLTILGYSLYDDVVVFDKIKETSASVVGLRQDYEEMVNRSLNEVLMRSLNTSLAALLPVGALLFAGVFLGAETLKDFALALFVGILAGTYSSIFIATPVIGLLGRPKGISQSAMKVARKQQSAKAAGPTRSRAADREDEREERPGSGRTKRPSPERLAELVEDDDEVEADEVETEAPPSKPNSAKQASGSGAASKTAGKSGKKPGPRQRPRGSRPSGGKKRKKKR